MTEVGIQTQELMNLLETNKRLLAAGNRQKILDFILDEAIRLSGAERGFIILKKEQEWEMGAARSFEREDLKKAKEKFSKTVFHEVMETGEALISMEAAEDKKLKASKSVMEMKLRSILCVPLRLTETPLGVLYLDHRFTEGAFQENQVRIVSLFADQAAFALNAFCSFEESERHAQEMEKLQRQLALLNDELQEKLSRAENERDRVQELLGRPSFKRGFEGIVGSSKALRKILRTIEQLKDSEPTIYIHGESGTGKELIARSIHQISKRKEKSFVAINCAAFSEQILDSELFGHIRGAFTGADRDRRGLFEEANGGSLFLDEVGEMSPGMQAKLLRVLQEREIRPVGSNTPKKVDVRVICASNKDLQKMVKEGSFREDLYYRLNVVRLDLPPLRDRPEDIADLIQHFTEHNSMGIPKDFVEIEPEAQKLLMNYRWPGNIRELQNEIQRCLVMGKGKIIPSLLSPQIQEAPENGERIDGGDLNIPKKLKDLERRLLLRALEECKGNKREAAEKLGISRLKLYQLIRDHGLRSEYGKLTGAQIRRVLREVRGNKSLAAKRLGIGRRTLYERLEKMGA